MQCWLQASYHWWQQEDRIGFQSLVCFQKVFIRIWVWLKIGGLWNLSNRNIRPSKIWRSEVQTSRFLENFASGIFNTFTDDISSGTFSILLLLTEILWLTFSQFSIWKRKPLLEAPPLVGKNILSISEISYLQLFALSVPNLYELSNVT